MGPKSGWGPDRLCQTSPIPRSPDGDNKLMNPITRQLKMPTDKMTLVRDGATSGPCREVPISRFLFPEESVMKETLRYWLLLVVLAGKHLFLNFFFRENLPRKKH